MLRVDPSGQAAAGHRRIAARPGHGDGAGADRGRGSWASQPGDVTVAHGDTAPIPFGVGTYASRNAVVAGNAALEAALAVRDKALALAAHLLEAAPADLELVDGGVQVRGAPDRRVTLGAACGGGAPGPAAAAGPGAGAGDDALLPGATGHVRQRICTSPWSRSIRETLASRAARLRGRQRRGAVDQSAHRRRADRAAAWRRASAGRSGRSWSTTSTPTSLQSLLDYCMPPPSRFRPCQDRASVYDEPVEPAGVKGLGEGGRHGAAGGAGQRRRRCAASPSARASAPPRSGPRTSCASCVLDPGAGIPPKVRAHRTTQCARSRTSSSTEISHGDRALVGRRCPRSLLSPALAGARGRGDQGQVRPRLADTGPAGALHRGQDHWASFSGSSPAWT